MARMAQMMVWKEGILGMSENVLLFEEEGMFVFVFTGEVEVLFVGMSGIAVRFIHRLHSLIPSTTRMRWFSGGVHS